MFRLFENLVNPFDTNPVITPPATLWAYIKTQLKPFRKWLPWMALMGFLVAIMESGLIFYSGRVIDLMAQSGPTTFWDNNHIELILVVMFILLFRPFMITLNHLFLEQTLASNMQEQARWQAHKHLLGQSSNFFHNPVAQTSRKIVLKEIGGLAQEMFMGLPSCLFLHI
jgi:ATP-binding cassette subfamily B multidrug efflux pump